MPSLETLLTDAVTAIEAGTDVDITGPRMSGRSSFARHLSARFRDSGWQVVEAADPARFESARILIVADDWEHLDDKVWAKADDARREHGAVLVTTRAGTRGGSEPFGGAGAHVSVELPALDAGQLRVLLTRVFGFILDDTSAQSLAQVSGGAVGVAISLVDAAREAGALEVDGIEAKLADGADWADAGAPVVASLVEPLTEAQRDVLRHIAQTGVGSSPGAAELVNLGYVRVLPDQAFEPVSPLLAAHYARQA